MDLEAEFNTLADLSGWNDVVIGDRLGKTKAYIGQIRNGRSKITKGTLDHFRMILKEEKPEIFSTASVAMTHIVLTEGATDSDFLMWKRRALDAEKRLNDFRNRVRALLDASSTNPVPVSSGVAPADLSLVDAAEDAADSGTKSSRLRGAVAPTGQKRSPSPNASEGSKDERGTVKRVLK